MDVASTKISLCWVVEKDTGHCLTIIFLPKGMELKILETLCNTTMEPLSAPSTGIMMMTLL